MGGGGGGAGKRWKVGEGARVIVGELTDIVAI